MTSSERKIINCLWATKKKTHIRLVAQKVNLSSDYARLLCRSLARSGHIKFENDLAHLLKKGRGRFDASTSLNINPEPLERIENNDPIADEPVTSVANVTLLTDEPVVALPANDRSDEEENQKEGAGELDKALADLESPSRKEEGEKIDEPEESEKTGSTEETEGKEEQGEEEILAEPAIEAEKTEFPGATETKPADSLALTASLESPEETAPSSGSGRSLKKIVNWSTIKQVARILTHST